METQTTVFVFQLWCSPPPSKPPHLLPDLLKRILPRPPPWSGRQLAGTLPSRRYLRAVFASMPAFAAAISRFLSTFPKANNLLTCLSVTKL